MKHTLKVTSGLNPELVTGSFPLPTEILMALEERLDNLPVENRIFDEDWMEALIPRAVKCLTGDMLGTKWLPKGADKVIESSRKDLVAMAVERGYPLSFEEQMAACVWNAQRLRDLEVWKEEQKKIRRASQHYAKEETAKIQTPDGRKWQDAQVYELPPLVQSDGKSLKHVDARYILKLPDGRVFDLGMSQGSFKAITSDGPDIALQRIAKRAGLDIRGGAHTVLQALTGLTDIIPSFMAFWHRNQWCVAVGWQKDPKLTPSSYYLEGDQLTRIGEPADRLTLSELDYNLLRGSAETEVEDFEGDVVDYMNEDEELVMQGFMRDETDEPDPIDSPLLSHIAEHLGLLIELRNGSAVWNHPEVPYVIGYFRRQAHLERRAIKRSMKRTKRLLMDLEAKLLLENSSYVAGLIKDRIKDKALHLDSLAKRRAGILPRLRDQEVDLASQSTLQKGDSLSRYWLPNHERGFGSMKGTEQHPPMFETTRDRYLPWSDLETGAQARITGPATLPEMTLAPANEVQIRNVVTDVPELGQHRVSVMNRVKRGTTALVETKHGLVAKRIDPLPQPMLNASNASPTLKAKLREICRAELETGTLYQEVADTFALALDSALRSLR